MCIEISVQVNDLGWYLKCIACIQRHFCIITMTQSHCSIPDTLCASLSRNQYVDLVISLV